MGLWNICIENFSWKTFFGFQWNCVGLLSTMPSCAYLILFWFNDFNGLLAPSIFYWNFCPDYFSKTFCWISKKNCRIDNIVQIFLQNHEMDFNETFLDLKVQCLIVHVVILFRFNDCWRSYRTLKYLYWKKLSGLFLQNRFPVFIENV